MSFATDDAAARPFAETLVDPPHVVEELSNDLGSPPPQVELDHDGSAMRIQGEYIDATMPIINRELDAPLATRTHSQALGRRATAMTKTPSRARRIAQRLVAATILIWAIIAVIDALQPRTVVMVRSSRGVSSLPLTDVLSRDFNPVGKASDVVIDLPTLAALTANVYEPPDLYDSACSPDKPGRIRLQGWEQLEGWSYPDACNAALNGLHYEVWSKTDSEGIGYQVVVFRGTLPTQLSHWCSNLRNVSSPICDPKSDQYLSIAPLIDQVLSGVYDEWGPDRYTLVAGHSLGGGLAELAGNASFVDQVFAFDPSPVTGAEVSALIPRLPEAAGETDALLSAYLKKSECGLGSNNLPNGRILKIRRVYEHGEVLAYLRFLKRWLVEGSSSSADSDAPQLTEYRTNVLGGNPFSQHSMKALACAMLERRDGRARPVVAAAQ